MTVAPPVQPISLHLASSYTVSDIKQRALRNRKRKVNMPSRSEKKFTKKRKLEITEHIPKKRKKFVYQRDPNLTQTLIQKLVGNWRKQKSAPKYEQKFINQYASSMEWNSRPHEEIIYREGGRGDLKVYTGLTESGCGIALKSTTIVGARMRKIA